MFNHYFSTLQKYTFISFKNRIFILILAIVCLQLTLISWYIPNKINKILYDEIGSRALVQAKQLAHNPVVIQSIQDGNIKRLREYISNMQHLYSDADFIVIGDAHEIRLVHPIPSEVGHHMQGDDNSDIFHNHAILTLRRGSLGFAIRGKSPIVDSHGNVIGIVSVGYLIKSIASWQYDYLAPLIIMLLVMFVVSILASYFFARHIKNQMLDMEPEEIALSLRTKTAILQSIYEGIIAVNKKGQVYTINDNALQILNIPTQDIQGKHIRDLVTPWEFFLPTQNSAETIRDEIITVNQNYLVANRLPCRLDDEIIGWIVSFRKKDEIYLLSYQLAEVKKHVENMRVLRHEYANKLSTIGGLIRLGSYQEAQRLIHQESEEQEQLVTYLTTTFNSNPVAAILLSKYSRAKELGFRLIFDPGCHLQKALPALLRAEELTAILGNLLDNAYEATRQNPHSNKTIRLLLNNDGEELIIEVSDHGIGIDPAIADHIFERGVTTKAETDGHGYGMYLVHQYVSHANGYITISDAEQGGAIFSIFIPTQSAADSPNNNISSVESKS